MLGHSALGDRALSELPPVAAGGTIVLPGVGAVVLTAFAPALDVSNNQSVTVGLGALTLAGFAPTANIGVNVGPGVGALSLAGQAPAVVVNTIVAADVGALTLAGLAPTVSAGASAVVAPDVGLLVLSGFAPTVLADAEVPRMGGHIIGKRPIRRTIVRATWSYAPSVAITPALLEVLPPVVAAVPTPAPMPVVLAPRAGTLAIDGHIPHVWTAPRPWDVHDDAILIAALYMAMDA